MILNVLRIAVVGFSLLPVSALAQETPILVPVADIDAAGTREDPYPILTLVPLSDDWTVAVLDVTPDATQLVLDENMFNDPPEAGRQFFMARITATYEGSSSDEFDASYRFRAVGPLSVSYSTFEDSCGVAPDEVTDAEVFSGGTIEGNICWSIKSEDAAGLVMYDDPFTFDDVERVFISLDNDALPDS